MDNFETARRTIGELWYEFPLPTGGSAGVRSHGRRHWGVYFRDYRGNAIEPTPRHGDELTYTTYDDAVRRIRGELPRLARLTLDQLDPPDLINHSIRVDQVAKITYPRAGETRYVLELDNLTENEARVALEELRKRLSRMRTG
jgi:hypothetical protein